jgi:cytochrome P450
MSDRDTSPIDLAAEFDPNRLGPQFYANPYPTYAALRTFDPVHRCPDGSFFLTRHADLDRIYRDRQHFSSDKKAVFGPRFGVGSPLYEHHTTSLVFNDPPYHARVRRQIVGALTPQVLNSMEPGVVALVDQLLDRMKEQRRFNLIADYAAAIPVEVIGNLPGRWRYSARWSRRQPLSNTPPGTAPFSSSATICGPSRRSGAATPATIQTY